MSVKNPTTYRPMQQIRRTPDAFNPNVVGNNHAQRDQLTRAKAAKAQEAPPPPSTLRKIADWFLGPRIPKDIENFQGSDSYVGTQSRHPLKTIESGPTGDNSNYVEHLSYLDSVIGGTKPGK